MASCGRQPVVDGFALRVADGGGFDGGGRDEEADGDGRDVACVPGGADDDDEDDDDDDDTEDDDDDDGGAACVSGCADDVTGVSEDDERVLRGWGFFRRDRAPWPGDGDRSGGVMGDFGFLAAGCAWGDAGVAAGGGSCIPGVVDVVDGDCGSGSEPSPSGLPTSLRRRSRSWAGHDVPPASRTWLLHTTSLDLARARRFLQLRRARTASSQIVVLVAAYARAGFTSSAVGAIISRIMCKAPSAFSRSESASE